MKYVILIHANPEPWDHPTARFTAEGKALSADEHAELDRRFDLLFDEMQTRGELVDAEALAAPSTSTVFRWRSDATEGPFTETAEQLAGFFHIDVESHERAVEIASQFAGPGSPAELRPSMWVDPRRQQK
ncbi:YciI family protein [Cellulomonas sp. URHD0024]|uniref:YciI family protein n=1 Tax=Cellulomonas sp. URHD0024 TaxID=1302620 RepID=UPI000487CA1C|nr:YciI family protein [Cellulomonas sp. URHD0024]